MIIYDLECGDGHRFEGWFKDRGAFDEQRERGLVACPVCGNSEPVMVPSTVARMARESRPEAPEAPSVGTARQRIRELQDYLRRNFDNVGDRFAEVALRIHHGEEEERNIRGTTTGSEEETLKEEGVPFVKISLPKYDG